MSQSASTSYRDKLHAYVPSVNLNNLTFFLYLDIVDIIMFPITRNITDDELRYILNQDLDDKFMDDIKSNNILDGGSDCKW